MTDTMKTEQRREAFEKWANSLALSLHRDPFPSKNYTSPATDYAYIGWCAALDSQAAQAQPHSEAVLKLLDEIESYLKEAQYYMDEEDRRGGAHGLYEKVRKYLIDVGYTYIQRVSTSHEGRQHE